MKIYCKGTAQVRHLDGGPIHTINPDDIEFESAVGEEREMGPETTHTATYDFDENGRIGGLIWTITEYPAGAWNYKSTSADRLKILKDFDFGFEYGPDD